jgi:hypothetical protein
MVLFDSLCFLIPLLQPAAPIAIEAVICHLGERFCIVALSAKPDPSAQDERRQHLIA